MDVTLKQLRYFVAVAEELSFTRAAARLHLSQPALSVQIGQARARPGCAAPHAHQPFGRADRRRARLPRGRPPALADLERARERARRTQEAAGATLRIAHTASVAYQALPLILDELAAGAPELVVSAHQAWSTRAVEEVLLGEADVALVREFAGGEGLRTEVVRREPLAAFMSTRHPLAGRGSLAIGDLRGHPVVVVPESLAPGFHSLVGRLCESRGFRPAEVEMTSPENREPLLAHLSRHPEHLFVGPVSMAGLAWEGVVHVPLGDADARIGLSIVWADARPTPAVGRALAAARAVAAREGWDAPAPEPRLSRRAGWR